MRFVLAFALSLASLPALADSASDAVRFFYKPDIYVADPAFYDRFAEPALTKFKQNQKQSADGDQVGCIDFALQYDAQDLDDGEVARSLTLTEGVKNDIAIVTASFQLFPGEPASARAITWVAKKVGPSWKISDIAAANGEWKLSEFDCE